MASSIPPVQVSKLAGWNRVYTFAFGTSFLEFTGPSPPTIATLNSLAVISGDGALNIVANVINNPNVLARFSGGNVGKTYEVLCEVTLSNDVQLSIPAVFSVVAPGSSGISQRTLAKLVDWDRYYLFPFGKRFREFQTAAPLSIVGTPVFAADAGISGGTPVVTGAGQNVVVSVFISGGTVPTNYNLSCTATLSDSSTLTGPSVVSIPGILSLVDAFA